MSLKKAGSTPGATVPPPLSQPTEAQIRAEDLEQNDTRIGQQQEAPEGQDPERESRIREAAYARSERRGFTPGHEEEDWLEAERDLAQRNRPRGG